MLLIYKMSYSDLYKDGDNVYYNITISNNTNTVQLAKFNETRRDIILCNPNEYYITIARFTVPLNSVPILIMPMETGSTTNSTLKVTLTHRPTNTDYTETVLYLPDNNLTPINQKFFYVYTYTSFIEMINNALFLAFTALSGAHAVTATKAPYFLYDPDTQLINLIAQRSSYDINSGVNYEIEIWGNGPLLSYCEALRVDFVVNGDPKRGRFLITANPNNENGYAPFGNVPADPADYIILKQEYKTIEYWNSFRNLLFTTNLLPIRNEYLPTSTTGEGVNNFFPILTDYEPLLALAGDTRSILNYVSNGQYRLTDILSTDCLRRFDLQLYWIDQDNVFHPLELYPNTTIKVKILFVRKSLYKRGIYLEKK
jgi:hypothetical protein